MRKLRIEFEFDESDYDDAYGQLEASLDTFRETMSHYVDGAASGVEGEMSTDEEPYSLVVYDPAALSFSLTLLEFLTLALNQNDRLTVIKGKIQAPGQEESNMAIAVGFGAQVETLKALETSSQADQTTNFLETTP